MYFTANCNFPFQSQTCLSQVVCWIFGRVSIFRKFDNVLFQNPPTLSLDGKSGRVVGEVVHETLTAIDNSETAGFCFLILIQWNKNISTLAFLLPELFGNFPCIVQSW